MDSNFAKKTGDWQTKGWWLVSGPMGIKLNDTVSQGREVNYVNNKQLLYLRSTGHKDMGRIEESCTKIKLWKIYSSDG